MNERIRLVVIRSVLLTLLAVAPLAALCETVVDLVKGR